MGSRLSKLCLAVAAAAMLATSSCSGGGGASQEAPKKTEFSIGWSIYAGWMPWPYAQQAGIVKKWADKYGIKINIVQVNDYVESVNQFTAGKLDGVTVTNMDALTIPAAGGKDTSAIILGDYSNGNDGIVLKNASSLADIKGRTVYLVELSVSHYLLARGLETVGLKLSDIKTMNTSDADIVGAFSNPAAMAAVTWNPQLTELTKQPGAKLVFDSHQIPGEILDTLSVDTATLKANPNLGKALAGIWYETIALMQRKDAQGAAARAAMAKLAGSTPQAFDAQLSTTHLYGTPQGRVRRDQGAGPHHHHDAGARLHLVQGPVRRGCGQREGDRRRFPRRQDHRRSGQRQAALRSDLHGPGRGGQALSRCAG